jgi:hypothetical protein
MSFVPFYRITNRMTVGLTQIERARSFLEAGLFSTGGATNQLEYKLL